MSGLPDEHAASREPGGPEERVSPNLLITQQLGQIGQQISRLEGRFGHMDGVVVYQAGFAAARPTGVRRAKPTP